MIFISLLFLKNIFYLPPEEMQVFWRDSNLPVWSLLLDIFDRKI